MAYKVDIPVGKQGGSSSSAGGGAGGGNKELTKEIKGLSKAVAIGNSIASVLSGVTSGLAQLFEPLIRVLSALFLVVFLPLMPLLTKLTEGIAKFTFDVAEAGGGLKGLMAALKKNFDIKELLGLGAIIAGLILVAFTTGLTGIGWAAILLGAVIMFGDEIAQAIISSIGEFWSGVLGVILVAAASIILFAIGGWVLLLVGLLVGGLIALWEPISTAFAAFFEDLKTSWSVTVDNFKYLFWEMPQQLWKLFVGWITSLGTALAGVGKMIANAFKSVVNGMIKYANMIIPGKRFDIPLLAAGGIVSKPTVAMIGEAGPEAVVPLSKMGGMGSTTININNPTIRNDGDIRKLADAVGRALQAKGNRRFSSL